MFSYLLWYASLKGNNENTNRRGAAHKNICKEKSNVIICGVFSYLLWYQGRGLSTKSNMVGGNSRGRWICRKSLLTSKFAGSFWTRAWISETWGLICNCLYFGRVIIEWHWWPTLGLMNYKCVYYARVFWDPIAY